ncbi:hypothetical protein ACEPAH_7141 [Sanghuangporus vaninii]
MNMNGSQDLEDATPGLFVTAIIVVCHHSIVFQNVVTVRTERPRTVAHFHVSAAGSTSPGAEIKADVHAPTVKIRKIKNANIMAVVTKVLIIDHPCSHRVADVATIPVTIHAQDLLAEVNFAAANTGKKPESFLQAALEATFTFASSEKTSRKTMPLPVKLQFEFEFEFKFKFKFFLIL